MKKIILLATLTFSLQAMASEFINQNIRNQIINSLGTYCADTWCGGDYDFFFKDLNCNRHFNTCDVTFVITTYDLTAEKMIESDLQTCTLKNIKRTSDLYSNKFNQLNEDFVTLVEECTLDKAYEWGM